MGCRCNERRDAILRSVKAAKSGDAKTVAEQMKLVARTSLEDAGSALRQGAIAAKQRLAMRR